MRPRRVEMKYKGRTVLMTLSRNERTHTTNIKVHGYKTRDGLEKVPKKEYAGIISDYLVNYLV